MKFVRNRIVDHVVVAGAFDANGNPTTTATETQAEMLDLVLGNGVSTWEVLQKDEATRETVTSIALPTAAAFTDAGTFELDVNGNTQIFVTCHIKDLGAAALTGINVLIEFQDPDHPEFWIPSKEGINREANAATHAWALTGVGDYMVASRVEHRHFMKARVRFKALSGVADGDTNIQCSWHHDGGRSLGEIISNDPNPEGHF